jgi:hypothetical protein
MIFVALYESGNGPKRTFRLPRGMSVFGGKADIGGMTKTIAFPYDCSKGTPKITAEMFQATYGPPSDHYLTSED